MKSICFLTSTLNYGGATKIMIELANYLTKFYEVTVVNYGSEELFYSINSKLKVVQAPATNCNVPKVRVFAQMMIIRSFFLNKNFDLVIAFGNAEKLMALAACFGKKTKVIISERQDPYNYVCGKKHTMWLRYILSDGCVFQTEGAMQYFPKSVQEKSTVIPNFITMKDYTVAPFNKRRKEIAFSARFELRQKRQDVMIKAMKNVVKKHSDWKLVFYGDGPDESDIKKMVKDYGLDDNVVFAGKIADVNENVCDSGMLVLTSDYEGIPNVLMEAMAMGIPVVTTDCSPGGARLLIENNYNGKIVDAGDISAISEAINEFIENPDLADYCGENAKAITDLYSPNLILPRWRDYFEEIIGN